MRKMQKIIFCKGWHNLPRQQYPVEKMVYGYVYFQCAQQRYFKPPIIKIFINYSKIRLVYAKTHP